MGGARIAVDCRPTLIAAALIALLRAAIGGKGLRVAVARAFATRCGGAREGQNPGALRRVTWPHLCIKQPEVCKCVFTTGWLRIPNACEVMVSSVG